MKKPTPEQAYRELRPSIVATATRFYRTHRWAHHGRPLEDVVADANTFFMEALDDFDPYHEPQVSLKTKVTWMIWNRLLDDYNKRVGAGRKAHLRTTTNQGLETAVARGPKPLQWEEIVETLSFDALEVVGLVFQPGPLRFLISARGDAPRDWRWVLRRHLIRQGWTGERVVKAFQEIREALV